MRSKKNGDFLAAESSNSTVAAGGRHSCLIGRDAGTTGSQELPDVCAHVSQASTVDPQSKAGEALPLPASGAEQSGWDTGSMCRNRPEKREWWLRRAPIP